MKTVYTHYGKIFTVMKRDMGQEAWGKDDLGSLERTVKMLRGKLIETFEEHCNYGL